MFDYEKASLYRKFYLLDGLNTMKMLLDEIRGEDNIISIEIDNSVWNRANEIMKGVVIYDSIINKTHYAAKKILVHERLKKIEELGLQDHNHLILILLAIAPWGLIEKNVNGELKLCAINDTFQQEADEIKKGMAEISKIFSLLQHEDANTLRDLPKVSDDPLEWKFESANITFRKVGNNSEPDLRLPLTKKGSTIFASLLIDFMSDLYSKGETMHDRFFSWRHQIELLESKASQVENPHYIFTYNFIDFLNTHTHFKEKEHSNNDLYRVYINLMELTPYKMKGYNTEHHKLSTLKQWHKKAKL